MASNNTSSNDRETDNKLRTDGGVTQSGGNDDEEAVPKTFYLQAGTKRGLNRWLKQLELDHLEVENADRRHQYEAIVRLAMEHEDEFIDKVEELS